MSPVPLSPLVARANGRGTARWTFLYDFTPPGTSRNVVTHRKPRSTRQDEARCRWRRRRTRVMAPISHSIRHFALSVENFGGYLCSGCMDITLFGIIISNAARGPARDEVAIGMVSLPRRERHHSQSHLVLQGQDKRLSAIERATTRQPGSAQTIRLTQRTAAYKSWPC